VKKGDDGENTLDKSSVKEASVQSPSAVAETAVEVGAQEEEEDNSFEGLFHAFDAGMVKYHDNTTNNPLDNLKE